MKIKKILAGISALTMLASSAGTVSAKSMCEKNKPCAQPVCTQVSDAETPEIPEFDAETEKAKREAEKAEREAQREAEKAEREAQREAEKAEREAQREAEKAEREAQREAEKAEREAKKEANKEDIKKPVAVNPELPEVSEKPEIPEVSEGTEKPDAPVKPEVSEESDAPVKPEDPAKPEAPVKPEVSVKPEAPVKPETPVKPAKPTHIGQCQKITDLIDLVVDQVYIATEDMSNEQILSIASIVIPLIRNMEKEDVKTLIKEVLADGVIDSNDIISLKNLLAETSANETI